VRKQSRRRQNISQSQADRETAVSSVPTDADGETMIAKITNRTIVKVMVNAALVACISFVSNANTFSDRDAQSLSQLAKQATGIYNESAQIGKAVIGDRREYECISNVGRFAMHISESMSDLSLVISASSVMIDPRDEIILHKLIDYLITNDPNVLDVQRDEITGLWLKICTSTPFVQAAHRVLNIYSETQHLLQSFGVRIVH
jgi:hypothetical protein